MEEVILFLCTCFFIVQYTVDYFREQNYKIVSFYKRCLYTYLQLLCRSRAHGELKHTAGLNLFVSNACSFNGSAIEFGLLDIDILH